MCCLIDDSNEVPFRMIRLKRRRGTIVNLIVSLLIFGVVFMGISSGVIRINYEGKEEITKLKINVNTRHRFNSKIVNKSEIVNKVNSIFNDQDALNDIETLFKMFDEKRSIIRKSIDSDTVRRITRFHEKELDYAVEREELQELLDYDAEEGLEVNKTIVNKIKKIKPNKFVDRDLMIKYLKIEKYDLSKRKKSLYTVKDYVKSRGYKIKKFPRIWNLYHNKINELQFPSEPEIINKVMHILKTSPIISAKETDGGTQVKVFVKFEDGTEAIIKPMRNNREYETPPDHYYFNDIERHNAEIATYHLDRLFGFHRIPPTVGRILNITKEVWETATEELADTFFYSPAGNVCFTGHCTYYCETGHAVCGRPIDRVEGSVQLMVPSKPHISWFRKVSMYRRSYSETFKAAWEINDNYCVDKVFQKSFYQSRHMLDLIDTAILDFLIGNMDRHHFDYFYNLGDKTFRLHLDNGRGFGKTLTDEMSILAPVMQCCFVRYSTFIKLKEFYEKKLSKLLDESLKSDPLYPVITDPHYVALDRRLMKILLEIHSCVEKHSVERTIVDDGY